MIVTATARPIGHPGYSENLPRMAESAAVARRLVRTALTAWVIEDVADNAELVVSELVTNAVEHARGATIRVIVARPSEDTVWIAVVDKDKKRPKARPVGTNELRGRGLFLVAAIAKDWGVVPKPWGKLVWALLAGERQR